jgi:hypothetical protein
VSRTICPGWPQTLILLLSASQVAGITGVSHGTRLPSYIFKCSKETENYDFQTPGSINKAYGNTRQIGFGVVHSFPVAAEATGRHVCASLIRRGPGFSLSPAAKRKSSATYLPGVVVHSCNPSYSGG